MQRVSHLQSRYYDPETGRFINADSPEYVDTHSGSPLSTNMFAYCENNIVNKEDNQGKSSFYYGNRKYTYKYDRKKAIEYAKQYYNVIETQHDFMCWHWTTYHGYNENFLFFENGDCTNFVSQCLSAGGIPITEGWYYSVGILMHIYSNSWTVAKEQMKYINKYLTKKKRVVIDGKSIKLKTKEQRAKTKKRIKKLIKKYKIRIGDVLYFTNGSEGYSHAAIISKIKKSGYIYYAAHTASYFNKSIYDFFREYPNDKIYIARIK